MRRQEGVTLTGFLVVAVVLIFVILFVLKVGPPYLEYFAIKKQLQALAADPVSRGTRREVEGAFVARAVMENIKSINQTDLVINKDGNDVVISAEYSVKVPLVGNLSACMDFNPSSAK